MTADLLQRTADTTELVLQQAKTPVEELDAIVMVGGSTLMPQVPRMIRKLTGQEPFTGISPHTSVAQGAAIHAAILEVAVPRRGRRAGRQGPQDARLGEAGERQLARPGSGRHQSRNGRDRQPRDDRPQHPAARRGKQVFKTNHAGQRRVRCRCWRATRPIPGPARCWASAASAILPPSCPRARRSK